MFWILCGIIAAVLYVYTVYRETKEITALDLFVSILIIFLGWFALLIALGMLIIDPDDINWADKLKNFVIYEKD